MLLKKIKTHPYYYFFKNVVTFRMFPTIKTTCDELPKGTYFVPIKAYGVNHVMIERAKRKIVMINIGGVRIPFYLSTGRGRKKIPTGGRWFPFWGMDPDGWFNKADSVAIVNYYGSDILKQVSEALDKRFGDIRGSNLGVIIPPRVIDVELWEYMRAQLNEDVKGTPVMVDGVYVDYAEFKLSSLKNFHDRIHRVIDKMNKGLAAAEQRP